MASKRTFGTGAKDGFGANLSGSAQSTKPLVYQVENPPAASLVLTAKDTLALPRLRQFSFLAIPDRAPTSESN
jgi:hypothetical protein